MTDQDQRLALRDRALRQSIASVRPELSLALADREFVFDGSPAWTPEFAIRAAKAKGLTPSFVRAEIAHLEAASAPVSLRWVMDRLSVLLTMFTVARVAPAPDHTAMWLAECARLLGDLPEDILAMAFDEAIRSSRHGFMPSVGEIRQFADRAMADRQQDLERMKRMLDAEWIAESEEGDQ